MIQFPFYQIINQFFTKPDRLTCPPSPGFSVKHLKIIIGPWKIFRPIEHHIKDHKVGSKSSSLPQGCQNAQIIEKTAYFSNFKKIWRRPAATFQKMSERDLWQGFACVTRTTKISKLLRLSSGSSGEAKGAIVVYTLNACDKYSASTGRFVWPVTLLGKMRLAWPPGVEDLFCGPIDISFV